MKIARSADCGNSPKNQLLEAMAIAMAAHDRPEIEAVATEDIVWERVGQETVHGREEFCRALESADPCTGISIEHVLSHGRAGAVNGVVSDGSGRSAFCHVYEFGSARGTSIRSVTTYIVLLPP